MYIHVHTPTVIWFLLVSVLLVQVWRLVTCFLFYGYVGFGFLFNMVFLYPSDISQLLSSVWCVCVGVCVCMCVCVEGGDYIIMCSDVLCRFPEQLVQLPVLSEARGGVLLQQSCRFCNAAALWRLNYISILQYNNSN